MSLDIAKFILEFVSLLVLIGIGSAKGESADYSEIKDAGTSSSGSPFLPFLRHQRKLLLIQDSCVTPAQPANGRRKLHRFDCASEARCEISEGIELAPGSLLNYTCDPGYKLIGDSNVLCKGLGIWSPIPTCSAIKCDALNSTSSVAKCFRLGRWVSCESSVLQGTRAKISCRPGYLPAVTSASGHSETSECNANGKWEPEPIECRSACGVAASGTTDDFPWRASLYRTYSDGGTKYFTCGATIVRSNLVLTAAKCVYETETNSTVDAKNLWVTAGNSFQDWEYPLHDEALIWRSEVKGVHVNCDYRGRDSTGDIALIEIKKPFEFSSLRLPACLDDLNSGDEPIDEDELGSIAEYGVTTQGRRPVSYKLPLIKTIPYVSYERCNASTKLVVSNGFTDDKFCAGHSNSSSPVCLSYDGGGLVFKKHELWYVLGIVSVVPYTSVFDNLLGCVNYVILTNVSVYTAWIEDVTFNLERYKSHPPCNVDGFSVNATTTTEKPADERSLQNEENPSCVAPRQPENGDWMFHPSLCSNDEECEILRGAPLRPGTQLIYRCAQGYVAKGSSEVYCGFSGNWSAIPVCTEIKCDSLNSVSTAASCYDRFGKWMSCDPAVTPGTRAEVACHLGYKKDTAFAAFRRSTVRCGENGKWKPDPIKCVPVCGVATTHQTPFIINGTPARLSDFPWHATLYLERNSPKGLKKDFVCGATIIHTNFILTAAHCAYDEATQTTTDPEKLFVMTGNVFRDYDSVLHNPVAVKRTRVRSVYRPCTYYGLRGNYASDIALLELENPFNFSDILSPACLDVEGHGEQILEPGAWGRVAGFGRTDKGESSGILQTLTLPYISYNQCKTPKDAEKNNVLISTDKFCAGYTDGSAVCEGDSGGGLVFEKSELWYVLGIVSVGLGVDLDNGEKTCDRYSYSLYTKVSEHMNWIQDVMFQRAQRNVYPPCINDV